MRFREFLRVAVLLFGGAGTALAAVAIAGAAADDDTLVGVAAGWWAWPRSEGSGWAGGPRPHPGIAGLLADARTTNTLPELEPGAVLFNRLWPLAVLTIARGAVGFFVPQVPAIATGYAARGPTAGASSRRRAGDRGPRRRGVLLRPQLAVRSATAPSAAGARKIEPVPERRGGPGKPASAVACAASPAPPRTACWRPAPSSASRGAPWRPRSACWRGCRPVRVRVDRDVTPASAAARA